MIGIERRDRLVGEQDWRLDRERSREHHAHPLAAGERRQGPVAELDDLGRPHRPGNRGVVAAG